MNKNEQHSENRDHGSLAVSHGWESLPAAKKLQCTMDAMFEEWWVKDSTPWMHANKHGARFLFILAFLAGRDFQEKQQADSPNENKISYGHWDKGRSMVKGN